ncbi:MAG: hypothetical protein CR993_06750 [Rhodobacterales bacterium]|nr:MAG: hypothetical protein CR993_06750 [Rhodobacterales bacterium]
MQRQILPWFLAALLLLAAAFYGLTRTMTPLIGYILALALYWLILTALILRFKDSRSFTSLLHSRPAPLILHIGLMLLLLALATVSIPMVLAAPPSAALISVAIIAALINGTLEETFWRGVALPPGPVRAPDFAANLILFTLWHVTTLFATGIIRPGADSLSSHATSMLTGAFVLGLIALGLRHWSSGAGLAARLHVGVNLLAFTALAATNPLP